MPEPIEFVASEMGKKVSGAARCHPAAEAEIVVLEARDASTPSKINVAVCPICGGFYTYTGG